MPRLSTVGAKTAELIRRYNWDSSPLGPRNAWPSALNSAVDLVIHSPDCMFLALGPELVFIPNDACESWLGSDLDRAFGQPMEALRDAWPPLVRSAIEQAVCGQAVRLENIPLVLPHRDDPETCWNGSFSPFHDGQNEVVGVLGTLYETTEQVATRAALTDREQLLDALIRSSSEVRFSISADWSSLHELKGGAFIADTLAPDVNWLEAYIPPEGRDAVRAEIARAISTQSTYHIEHPVNRVDGSVGWAHVRAVPLLNALNEITGWLGAASDITDRKRAAEALAISETQLRALNLTLEQQVIDRTAELRLFRDVIEANVPTCIFDTDCRQIAFNSAHEQTVECLFGVKAARGEVLPDLLPEDQGRTLRDNMERALRGEAFRLVVQIGASDLALRSFDFSFTPLRDASNNVVAAFFFAHDVTERIKAQIELDEIQSALRQTQKLEAIGQLTGGVAHDFNNLLTIIKSSSELLKKANLAEEKRARYVDAISDTVDRASRLTNQLLAFARRQALQPELFAACDGVRSVREMLSTLAGSEMEIVAKLPDDKSFVYADRSQFETSLVNMALNARDALDGKGRITISVEAVAQIPSVRKHAAIKGDYIAVSVSDNGSGIPAALIDTIFEPFFTTKMVGKGTGLGLSQVLGFAKQSGGEVQVESEVGAGARFTLFLPQAQARAIATSQLAALEPLRDDHGTRILVVEDNIEIGNFCVGALTDLGYNPTLARDGKAALELLGDPRNRYDIVFSDVVMPRMDGIQLGKIIRERFPLVPVVLTSGYSEILAQHGSFGFELLKKPYSITELSSFLARVVRSVS